MMFVKSAKLLGLALVFFPIKGCAIGTGILFASLCKAVAYNPEADRDIFIYAILGFALIETFAFILIGVAGLILVF